MLNYERYFVLLEQTGQLTKFLEENKETLKTINERGAVPEEILIKLKVGFMFSLKKNIFSNNIASYVYLLIGT